MIEIVDTIPFARLIPFLNTLPAGSLVVTGPPGSGKTTLGAYLSKALGYPLIGFDLATTAIRNGIPYNFEGSDNGKVDRVLSPIVSNHKVIVDNYVSKAPIQIMLRIPTAINKAGVARRNENLKLERTEQHHQDIDDYDFESKIQQSDATKLIVVEDISVLTAKYKQ